MSKGPGVLCTVDALDEGMSHVLSWTDDFIKAQDFITLHRIVLDLKHESYASGIFHLIVLDHSHLQVTETMGSKSTD